MLPFLPAYLGVVLGMADELACLAPPKLSLSVEIHFLFIVKIALTQDAPCTSTLGTHHTLSLYPVLMSVLVIAFPCTLKITEIHIPYILRMLHIHCTRSRLARRPKSCPSYMYIPYSMPRSFCTRSKRLTCRITSSRNIHQTSYLSAGEEEKNLESPLVIHGFVFQLHSSRPCLFACHRPQATRRIPVAPRQAASMFPGERDPRARRSRVLRSWSWSWRWRWRWS